MVTVFAWGYEGWGNSTRELLQAVEAVERAHGFEPPVFVDVRVRRQVRATGFQDDTFERRVGRARHRWMPGLGNAAVSTGEGPMRLVAPQDAHELLGLALAQWRQRRRVIFFCSCGSPFAAASCHRQLVRRELLAAARTLGVALQVQEWPGGALRPGGRAELAVGGAHLEALRAGAQAVRLGRALPDVKLLGWPSGGLLRLRAGEDTQLVSVAAARFHGGEWRMPLAVQPVAPDDAALKLLEAARRWREEGLLETFPADRRATRTYRRPG